jgi:methyl-accepting chemotaxis protein
VAGEVRNLAQRSSASAREIKELIEYSMSFVQAGSEQAEGVGRLVSAFTVSVSGISPANDRKHSRPEVISVPVMKKTQAIAAGGQDQNWEQF